MGYWGATTSNVDWCERNYEYSYYIAEFWNTISSTLLCILSVFGIYISRKFNYPPIFVYCFASMFLVGFGSTAFHGTLQGWAQALDELPMVLTTVVFFYTILFLRAGTPIRPLPTYGLLLYLVLFLLGYYSFPQYIAFLLVVYAVGVVAVMYLSMKMFWGFRRSETSALVNPLVCICIYLAGFTGWALENLFCENLQFIQLHAWWHLASGTGTYLWVIFAVYHYYRLHPQSHSTLHSFPVPHVFVDLERGQQEKKTK